MQQCAVVCLATMFLASCGGGKDARMSLPEDTQVAVAKAKRAELADRKIVYESEIRLVVRDFSELENAISNLVKEHKGYLGNVSISRNAGEQRSGRWLARVPVDEFESFLSAIAKLGIPESRQQSAKDVTEEYVDLGARIANKKRLEERILKLLNKSDDEIKNVIEVERELARVRGDIERMQGRLRFLTNRTELTTVKVHAREQRDYVPPQSPTFATRIRETWGVSISSLRKFGEDCTVVFIALVPWLAIIAVLTAPLLWWARRQRLQQRLADSTSPSSPSSG